MKKGTAMEGFIRDDGTIRPIEHYDDTELRGKIQTNTDNINNLDSRVTELEEHGGVEDPTKADKVENATAGNLASLDENGNLQDSGKKSSDFAAAAHGHKEIRQTNSDDELALVSATANEDGDLWINLSLREAGEQTKIAQITYDNIDNLKRALRDPSSTPEDDANKLITSKAVFDALQEAEGLTVDSNFSLTSTNPVQNKKVYEALLGKEGNISRFDLVYDNNVWKLSHAEQTLEDMNLNDIMFCIFKIKPSASITYYAFGSLRRTWDGQGIIEVQVAVLGHLLSWDDQVQDEQQAEEYRFDNPVTLSVQSTNSFPTI